MSPSRSRANPCLRPSSKAEDPTSLFYFDTSALTKTIVEEHGTTTVRRLLESNGPETACASALQQVELRSAIVMRRSRKELTLDEADRAFAASDELLTVLAAIPVSDSILKETAANVWQTRLRSLDAIQLATALSISRLTAAPLTFVAADKRLLEAAQASRLATLNPEEPTL